MVLKILHKATIETGETKKTTHLLQVGWLGPSFNSLDLRFIYMNTLRRHKEIQENKLINTKKAFVHISIKALFPKGLQHGSKMGDMILKGFAKDKNIIKIYHNKYTNIGSKNKMHDSHESIRCFG